MRIGFILIVGALSGCTSALIDVPPARPDVSMLDHAPAPTPVDAAVDALLDAGSDAAVCIDADDDGYGEGCAAGPDCRDDDPARSPGAAERCDGEDDDCDGRVDEAFGDLGQVCISGGDDGCPRRGRVRCADDGAGARCVVPSRPPDGELCNDADDDCDGVIDEGAVPGTPCIVGRGICQRDGITICDDDDTPRCDTGDVVEPSREQCNGLDDDCDGRTDEGFDLGEDCRVGVGGCARVGQITCDPGGVPACSARAGDPIDEICNRTDDDCDGALDEGFDLNTDRVHCGRCEDACAADELCQGGECLRPDWWRVGPVFDTPTEVGWRICFDGPYLERAPLDGVLAACDGAFVMLGCVGPDAEVPLLRAMGDRATVWAETDDGDTTTHNGLQWYRDRLGGLGFGPLDDPIVRRPCDESAGEDRLCWPIRDAQLAPGSRCGAVIDLEEEPGWRRIIWTR